ncbi:von Hippel-Lindau disease tumor suppressor [Hyperolius riggenbachi]|uniref:von Hippel-Lindau disease tumor suppressor n=1 Tax=Hyperolius riggenbachi TaxID=752182 RepID=UPI0035A3354C
MPQPVVPPTESPPVLRSANNRQTVYAVFYNYSPRYVVPLWLDFNGEIKPYPTLPPYRGRKMGTYVGHIWIFREAGTEDRMRANGRELYSAEPTENGEPEVVNICLDMYTLKDRCLQVVRKLVDPSDWTKLDIVKTLHDDLKDRPKAERDVHRMAVKFWKQTRGLI